MKIGLLGGTFNPIHKGHLSLALEARRQFGLTRVYLVLSPKSPFKKNLTVLPLKDRLSMLRLALRGKKSLAPGLWELKESGPSYSVRTLEKVAKDHPSADLYFIMGSDAWKGFSRWKNPHKILQLATLLVGKRPGTTSVQIPASAQTRVRVLKGVFPDVSSSSIRQLKEAKKLKSFLPPTVLDYIRRHGLYE